MAINRQFIKKKTEKIEVMKKQQQARFIRRVVINITYELKKKLKNEQIR